MNELVPITLRAARRFVAEYHRHNGPPKGWRFGVALEAGGCRIGVGIASRPNGRGLDDGRTIEVMRLCLVEGAPKNSASRLYGALNRAAKALGYRRSVTYTLESEDGASLRAAGYTVVARLPAREEWTQSEGVKRYQRDIFGEERRPSEAKLRWERSL